MKPKIQWSEHAPSAPEGERVRLAERVVVAPAQGRFRPLEDEVVGRAVADGQTVGLIDRRDEVQQVVSPFAGQVVEMLVHKGELVREGEPIVWLRVS